MLRVDPEKMEAELAALRKAMESQVNLPGARGTIARMQMQVLPALTRWRTGEINRIEFDPNDVANALVALISCTLFSEACSVYGDEIASDHYKFFNNMMQGIAEEFGALLGGTRPGMTTKYVGGTEAGTA